MAAAIGSAAAAESSAIVSGTAPGYLGQPGDLLGPDHRVVEHERRAERRREDLGLARLRGRQAGGTARELQRPDLARLVGLRVRIEIQAVSARVLGGPGQVAIEPVEVDDQRRSLELGDRSADAHAVRSSTATQSISTLICGRWAPTVVRAGSGSSKKLE